MDESSNRCPRGKTSRTTLVDTSQAPNVESEHPGEPTAFPWTHHTLDRVILVTVAGISPHEAACTSAEN